MILSWWPKRPPRKKTGASDMVKILDSTLREGEQTPGVYFDIHVKLAIAGILDELGVDFIEAGHPAVTEDIAKAVTLISAGGLKSKIAAHSRSMRSDIDKALECRADFIGIFYCVSNRRLQDYSTNLVSAVDKITSVIRYAKEKRPSLIIRYTPEDTVRSKYENVLSAAKAAVSAGADIISVADTTVYMIPGTERSMYEFISRLKDDLGKDGLAPFLEVHCHNDRGLAAANSLDAIRAGAHIVDAAVLGLGERAGITDLGTLLAVLSFDFGLEGKWNTKILPEIYATVSRYSNVPVPVNLPATGKNAFTHCAGVHTQAAIKNPLHYESFDPGRFGRASTIALDHMSGISSLQYNLEKIGEPADDREWLNAVLQKVKEVGKKGRTVDLEELKMIVKYQKELSGGIENENRVSSFAYQKG